MNIISQQKFISSSNFLGKGSFIVAFGQLQMAGYIYGGDDFFVCLFFFFLENNPVPVIQGLVEGQWGWLLKKVFMAGSALTFNALP